MYDIIFISTVSERYKQFKEIYPIAKNAKDFRQAQRMSLTEFFWVVWDNLEIIPNFNFDYQPDTGSKEYIHVFKNADEHNKGILLVPKTAKVSDKEIEYRFFVNIKEVDLLASKTKQPDIIYITTVNVKFEKFKNRFKLAKCAKDFREAQQLATTEFFWIVWDNLEIIPNFNFDYYPDNGSKEYIHVFKNADEYNNGILLIPNTATISDKEIAYRFFLKIKEVDIVASKTEVSEIFYISNKPQNYENFKLTHPSAKNVINFREAQSLATTEFFWVVWDNLEILPDFNFDYYPDVGSREYIHVFENADKYNNGILLVPQKATISDKEIAYRFFIKIKEVDITASKTKPAEIFYISINKKLYKEFKEKYPNAKYAKDIREAQQLSLTEFFWVVWDNLEVLPDFNFDYYPDVGSREYIHVFQNADEHNKGILLVPVTTNISDKEIEYRFFIKIKEVDITASKTKPAEIFYISKKVENYNIFKEKYPNAKYATDVRQAQNLATTEFFWIMWDNLEVLPDFNFDYYPDVGSRTYIHAFKNLDEHNKGIFLIPKSAHISDKEILHKFFVNTKYIDIFATKTRFFDIFYVSSNKVLFDIFKERYPTAKYATDFREAQKANLTEFFWAVWDNLEVLSNFEFDYHPDVGSRDYIHTFKNKNFYNGISLFPKNIKVTDRELTYRFFSKKKELNIVASTPKPYDVVFISYQEPNADENYEKLMEKIPYAKRIHGVKGIHQAHIEAAKLCNTDMFWIVDGDALIMDDFNFDYQIEPWDLNTVHVWRSQNPINDLIYGYGGVKLFPRELTINMDVTKPDMTTSISNKFKAINQISNITSFNTDPFNTWKSAFRECCKLSSKVIDRQNEDETNSRLSVWTTKGEDKPYGKYSIAGAKSGAAYGARNKGNIEALTKINDFDWLKEQFNNANT